MVIIVYLIFLALLVWAVIYLVPLALVQACAVDRQLDHFIDQLTLVMVDLNRALGIQLPVNSLIHSLEANANQMLQPERVFRLLLSSSSNIVWLVVIAITVFHLLRDWERLREWFFGLLPDEVRPEYRTLHKRSRISGNRICAASF